MLPDDGQFRMTDKDWESIKRLAVPSADVEKLIPDIRSRLMDGHKGRPTMLVFDIVNILDKRSRVEGRWI